MLHVGVCDDDKILCADIERLLNRMSELMSRDIEIEVFYSGEEILKHLESGAYFDMIFLDIEMLSLNGIEVGELIREEMNNETTKIIYISGNDSYAMELFNVRPLNFLIKPINQRKLEDVFRKAVELLDSDKSLFTYHSLSVHYKVPVKDIIYFESRGKKVRIITIYETKEFCGKLSEVIESIDNQAFLSIHKSYLVNYGHIIEYHYEHVKMSDKILLPISQKHRRPVRDKVMKLKERSVKYGDR